MEQKTNSIHITVKSDEYYAFTSFIDIEESFETIFSLWTKHISSSHGETPNIALSGSIRVITRDSSIFNFNYNSQEGEYSWSPPDESDWKYLLKGSRTVNFKNGETIIDAGKESPGLFQLCRGACKIVQPESNKVLGYITADDDDPLLGEISFLEGGLSTALVVADSDEVIVRIIETYYLNVLYQLYPHIAPRFYYYLAQVLYNRLKKRGLIANSEEETTTDPIITS